MMTAMVASHYYYNLGRGLFVFSLLSGCNNHHNGNKWAFVESRLSLPCHIHRSKYYKWNNEESDYARGRRLIIENGHFQQQHPQNPRRQCEYGISKEAWPWEGIIVVTQCHVSVYACLCRGSFATSSPQSV